MNNTISHNALIEKSKAQISSSIDDEEAVLDTQAGIYYSLNSVGSYIWKYLDTPKTMSQILEHVKSEYEVDDETCQASVEQLLLSLKEYQLITIRCE
ncbi:PqqD family protein [Halomonas sp. E19]|uniref:PqqD family protein n=1 Tax=Halomonas sp. E19 TaxID=3397247 RepID=UPI004033E593